MKNQGSCSWEMLETSVSPCLPFSHPVVFLWQFWFLNHTVGRSEERNPERVKVNGWWPNSTAHWLLYKSLLDLEVHRQTPTEAWYTDTIRQVDGCFWIPGLLSYALACFVLEETITHCLTAKGYSAVMAKIKIFCFLFAILSLWKSCI